MSKNEGKLEGLASIRVAIDLDLETIENLEKYAKVLGIRRAQAMRAIIIQFFNRKV